MSYIVQTKFNILTKQAVLLYQTDYPTKIQSVDIKVNGKSVSLVETSTSNNAFKYSYSFPSTGTYDVTYEFDSETLISFKDCEALVEATLPQGITTIKYQAFYGTGLTSIIIPEGVTTIEELAFANCTSLESVHIPASVTSIEETSSFVNTYRLASITVEPGNSVYDSRDNSNCIIQTSNNTIIVGSSGYKIPSTVTSIGEYAFYKHQFTTFTVPDNITSIGSYAFAECSSLKEFYIGANVSHIGPYVFSQCYHLHTIYSSALTPPSCVDSTFNQIGNSIPAKQGYLYVMEEAIPAYESEWTYLIDTLGWIVQRWVYVNVTTGGITNVSATSGNFIVDVQSNAEWTISSKDCLVGKNDIEQIWTNSIDGSGNDAVFVKYDEWFTYNGPRILTITVTSELGDEMLTVTQANEAPWITFSSSTKTLPHTGGSITFENYAAVTNCESVTLTASDGTVTPANHNGKWGDTNSMDFVWEIPETEAERTLTLTGTAEVSDGTTITGSFSVKQSSPHTFYADTDSLRWIEIDGGDYTMEYTTDVSSIELSLTKVPDFVTGFSYTQPVNGVGTFTITYADAHYTLGRYSHPVVVALYDGIQIGTVRLDDYQLGTGFWLPDIEQTISYKEQIIEVKIHNVSCDLQESNLSLHQSVPGLTVVSYTPQTTHISTDFGILYVKVPHNPGETRTFTIKVDALNNEGVVFDSDTGVTITQLEIPPTIYVDLEVDAGYNKVEVDHSLYGDWWVLSKVNWIKAETRDGSDPGIVTVIVGGNPTKDARVGYVHIYGETQTYIVTITQSAIDFSFDPDDKLIPICEPITYSEATDKLDYLVVDQEVNGLKYVGRAHKYPDSDEVVIELNDILSDTLRNNISFTNGLQEMDGYVKKFGVQNQETGGGSIIYSYKAWKKPKWVLLNDPISNEVDPRQYVFVNYLDAYDDLTLHKNGEQVGALGKICGCAYVIPREDAVCGEEVWYDVKVVGEDVLAVQNFIYKSTDKNYALYYLNNYGGWDSLAIRGNITQTDNIQSQTYKNKTNGKVKYLNQITPTWSLNTDSMNDGSKMYHLLESTQVYLHNLETDEIIPVVITDTSCVYKTYSNQGNTRFYYTINVEASNYKIRK